jgi:hypothetical protein
MERKLYEATRELPETALDFDQLAQKPRLPKKYLPLRYLRFAVAACIVLAVCIAVGVPALRAEAQEYRDALAFFQANGMSVEGLTRAEIKAVYKDITTESFTYSKTGQVIQNSLTQEQIEGWQIQLEDPTAEDIKEIWNYKSYNRGFKPYGYPEYMIQAESIMDSTGTQVIDWKYYIERREDGETVKLADVPIRWGSFYPVSDGVLVLGWDSHRDEFQVERFESWVLKLSHEGQILWMHRLENGFRKESPKRVLENADGTYTLFSCGDQSYLCVSRYTPDGQRTLYKTSPMEHRAIFHAAHYDGGYLLHVGGSVEDIAIRFIRVDQQGNITEGFSYSDTEYIYRIQDMVEHGGKVYISAYTVPRPETFPELMGEPFFDLRQEVDRVQDKIHDYGLQWQEAPVAALLRDNYRAVLLICDPKNGGKLETFYTVNGSLGRSLILTEDGTLIWETESFADAYYSPATSAFNIVAQCYVYQHFFDGSGKLYSLGKTDRVTSFVR